jgi:hypothetical protein
MPAVVRERYGETDRPDGPALRVNTHVAGDKLAVDGETDGAVVAVRTPQETRLVEPEDGEFEARLAMDYGENQVTVAAATDADLTVAGTTVRRFTL